jgi:hypothetical protein
LTSIGTAALRATRAMFAVFDLEKSKIESMIVQDALTQKGQKVNEGNCGMTKELVSTGAGLHQG